MGIDVNTLKIGNWVKYNENEYVIQALDMVGTCRISRLTDEGAEVKIVKTRALLPIQITKQWLLDFNFYIRNEDGYWYPKGMWHRYVFHNRGLFMNCIKLEPEGHKAGIQQAIAYSVHELQNLFESLTQKKLIKNGDK